MCYCSEVEMGSYDVAIPVQTPPHMKEYGDNRVKAGLSDIICIDSCILAEIIYLWSEGIHTRGCCCGHNIQDGMVNVADESIDRMLELGYEEYPNPFHSEYGKPFTFYTKTFRRKKDVLDSTY